MVNDTNYYRDNDSDEQTEPVPFTVKVIRLELGRKFANHFLQTVERALRFQRDIDQCL